MNKPVILVHGGAGEWPEDRHRAALMGVGRAAAGGWKILRDRGTAMDAVEAAVVSMEDNPIFNAGTGSALNLAGEVETDASIMDGARLRGGAVAIVRGVRNPVRLARIVMERTDHVLMAGRGAERLARAYEIPRANLKVRDRVQAWRRGRIDFERGKLKHLSRNYKLLKRGLFDGLDTVGALALDTDGNLAAACSTGGLSLKLPGRIGDTAILGAGLYADNDVGAATATGVGEIAIRTAISKTACDMMGKSAAGVAAQRCIKMVSKRIGKGLGIQTLDLRGRYGVAHSTRHMCWAVVEGSGKPQASMFGTRL